MDTLTKDYPHSEVSQTEDVLAEMKRVLAQLQQEHDTNHNLEPVPPDSHIPATAREGGTTRRRGRPPRAHPETLGANDMATTTVPTGLVTAPVITPGQRAYSSPTEAHAPKTNKPSFADMLVIARELGEQAGKGRDVQIKFLLKVAENAYLGVLDTEANKHSKDVDDATKLSEEYYRAQNGAVIFDAKAGNQRKTISTTRTMIKLGMWPKGGQGEPLATLNNLIGIRQTLRKDPANQKKLDDAANSALRYARAQLKRDQLIPEEELRGFCFKPEQEEASLQDVLVAMAKKAKKWGETTIVAACNKRLTELAGKGK